MMKTDNALSTQSIDSMLTAAFALTHKIHALDKIRTDYPKGGPQRQQVADDVADLRSQRDIIVREIKRRAGEL